jgi:hypothetical protein
MHAIRLRVVLECSIFFRNKSWHHATCTGEWGLNTHHNHNHNHCRGVPKPQTLIFSRLSNAHKIHSNRNCCSSKAKKEKKKNPNLYHGTAVTTDERKEARRGKNQKRKKKKKRGVCSS